MDFQHFQVKDETKAEDILNKTWALEDFFQDLETGFSLYVFHLFRSIYLVMVVAKDQECNFLKHLSIVMLGNLNSEVLQCWDLLWLVCMM